MSPDDVTTVIIPSEDRFKFLIFGGFYLSVIRGDVDVEGQSPRSAAGKGKTGDAIIVLADSRDPDIRMFDKTKYKLVDFFTKKVTDFQVPESHSMKASKSGLGGLLGK